MSQTDVTEQAARKAVHLEAAGAVTDSDITALKGTATPGGDTLGELETLANAAQSTANAIKAGTSASNDTLIEVFDAIASAATALKNGATAGGDTLKELENRIVTLESAPAPEGGAEILDFGVVPDESDGLGGTNQVVFRVDAIAVTGSNVPAVNKDYIFNGIRDATTQRKQFTDGSSRKILWDNGESKWKIQHASGAFVYYESEDDVDSPHEATFTAVGGGATDPITVTQEQVFTAAGSYPVVRTGDGQSRIGLPTRFSDEDGTFIHVDSSGTILFNAFGFQAQIDGESGLSIDGESVVSPWKTLIRGEANQAAANATLTDDATMQFAGVANKNYIIRGRFDVFNNGAPGFKFAINWPNDANASCLWVRVKTEVGAGNSDVWYKNPTGAITPIAVGFDRASIEFGGTIAIDGTGGTVAFQHAQATSDAAQNVIRGGVLEYAVLPTP